MIYSAPFNEITKKSEAVRDIRNTDTLLVSSICGILLDSDILSKMYHFTLGLNQIFGSTIIFTISHKMMH